MTFGLVALAVLAVTAVVNVDSGQRVAAATGAATIVLALIAIVSLRQNVKLLAVAVGQAEDSRARAESSRQLALAAAEQAAASVQQALASEMLAEAAGRQAEATLALVQEARLDRELEFQPVITVRVVTRSGQGGRQSVQVAIANVGRGTASQVALAYHEFADPGPGHLFGSESMVDFGPGESDSSEMSLGATASNQANRRLTDDLPEPALAAGFEDVLGNRYRWAATPSGHGRLEVWRPGAAAQPDWSRW